MPIPEIILEHFFYPDDAQAPANRYAEKHDPLIIAMINRPLGTRPECPPEVIKDKINEFKELVADIKETLIVLLDEWENRSAGYSWLLEWQHEEAMKRLSKAQEQLNYWQILHRSQQKGRDGLREWMDMVAAAKHVPIPTLIAALAVTGGTKIRCPIHEEKTPSFVYYKSNNSWHCFGCAQGGDVIALYMHIHKCDFKTAVRELAGT